MNKINTSTIVLIGVSCLIVRHFELKKIFTDNEYLNKIYKSVFRDTDQEVELTYKF